MLCARCFKASEHQGHDISFTVSGGGGCCDCGDKEAFPEMQCGIHKHMIASELEQV